MKNWDSRDELGYCRSDADRADAQFVCDRLRIPLHDANFVKEYWNNVFSYLLKEYQQGFTPNPDIYCNKYIKFDAFLRHAEVKFAADAIATGHYAQIGRSQDHENVKLLRAVDDLKDQTLFLSQISQQALRRCLFPVGHMNKTDVKCIAQDAGLEKIVKKKESMGICFIGKRDFKSFMEKYIDRKPGAFIDIETGKVVGQHNGLHHYTIGQRSHIGGQAIGYFIVKMDAETQNIFVAPGTHHPALYADHFTTEMPHWIRLPPTAFTTSGCFRAKFQFQHVNPLVDCRAERSGRNLLSVSLDAPLRAITPGQFAAFYDGGECLGSARIFSVGRSLYELDGRTNAVRSQ